MKKDIKATRPIDNEERNLSREMDDDEVVVTMGQQMKKARHPNDGSSTHAGAFRMRGSGGQFKDLKQRSV